MPIAVMHIDVGFPHFSVCDCSGKRTTMQAELDTIGSYMSQKIVRATRTQHPSFRVTGHFFRGTVPESYFPEMIDEIDAAIQS